MLEFFFKRAFLTLFNTILVKIGLITTILQVEQFPKTKTLGGKQAAKTIQIQGANV